MNEGIGSRAVWSLAAGIAAAHVLLAGPARAGEQARASVRAAMHRAASAYADLEAREVAKLSSELDVLVANPAIVAAFAAHDRKGLLELARPRFEKLKAERDITQWYFHEKEPARTCFLRVHAPALHGDVVDRTTLTQAIASHQLGSGKELGKTAFALRVVKPVTLKGTLVGYMELGEEIDRLLEHMKAQTGDDYGLFVDKARIDRKELARVRHEDRWDERPDVVLIESTIWNDRNVQLGVPLAKLSDEGDVVREWTDGAESYIGGVFPVRDAGKQVVGALFVRHRITP